MRMAETGGAESPMMSLSWVTLAIVVVIGIFSIFSLWLGFQAYGSDHPEQANYYIIIGTTGFAIVGYMFFRTKSITTKKPLVPKADVITILECASCDLKRVRDFQRGDYVYKEDEPCTRCEGNMIITGIHRRAEPQKESPRQS
ncbi:MAG: hypothetical protein JSV18_01775 [Candidatus Bathyarchaeota archaeon]|nr:MAG: hypothetical protein JSV18_01775 [Candidatus Bathyarchaeota archaeon]